ncbi:MAG TPA: zinc-dependent peptidase [Perlabentimonas sp.]|nr:zinc-dependent peptidase [Perlabentimonas sp.]
MPVNEPLFILMVIFILSVTFLMVRGIYRLSYISKAEARRVHSFYSSHSTYYNKLNKKLQQRFLQRAFSLTQSLKIVGRGTRVNHSVKYMVVAALVQVTFGLNSYFLKSFRTIFVYPSSYRHPHTGNMHDGEVHPDGLICLSIPQLVKGFNNPTDVLNLGLHEMAHAFMHSILSKKNSNTLVGALNEVLAISEVEVGKIKEGQPHIFRSYAGESVSEFFAVAIEHFFENSQGLQSSLPLLYTKLTVLLNQDPARNVFYLRKVK